MSMTTLHSGLYNLIANVSGVNNCYDYQLLVSNPESDSRVIHSGSFQYWEVIPIGMQPQNYPVLDEKMYAVYNFRIFGHYKIEQNQSAFVEIVDNMLTDILENQDVNYTAESSDMVDEEVSIGLPKVTFGAQRIGNIYLQAVQVDIQFRDIVPITIGE